MPMTPQGRLPIHRAGEYVETLVCLGLPRCKRTGHLRAAQQTEGCAMCRREYQYVEVRDV